MQAASTRRLEAFCRHIHAGKPVSVCCRKTAEQEEEEEGPLSGLKVIPLVGDSAEQNEDYIGGLEDFVSRVDPKTGLGYYLNEYGNEVLLVTNPDHVTEILSTCVEHYLWGGIRDASAAYFGKKVLFILEGDEWRELRGLMRPAFMNHSLSALADDTSSTAQLLCSKIEPYAQSGEEIDMLLAFAMYHLSAIGKSAFNYDLKCMENLTDGHNTISSSFEFLLADLPRRAFSPHEEDHDYDMDNEQNRQWKSAHDAVHGVIRTVVAARLQDRAASKTVPDDLLNKMVTTYEEKFGKASDPEKMTEELGANLVEILFAGYNTAVIVMANALYFLSQNPQQLKLVQEEVDRLGGRAPTFEDIEKLPLCAMVFQESLRLAPPAPMIARMLDEDIEIESIPIPAGVEVMFPAWKLHKDPRWWENPEAFMPQRFAKAPKRGAYIPFSDGPRSCIGRHFAQMEAVTAFAVLLQKYNFQPSPNFEWQLFFSGFGFRPFDKATGQVCMRMIVQERK